MLIFLVGISAAGKTFFARKIFNILKKKNKCFHIDGDEFRKYISYDLDYTLKSRYKNGLRVKNFCKYLISKKYIVILSMQSAFKSMQLNFRKEFKPYVQINISKKNSITKFSKNKKNVLGKDIKFNPAKGNINIENKKNLTQKNVLKIVNYLKKIKTKKIIF